ncbi:MAG TPA: AMP-binding protein, partial [Candidatus Limnocylindrales bacterium]|nr:AMP-binding protein [Candidatus Limnocylindrales bacterium]
MPDAAWRPTRELLAESRLAGLLRASGAAGLEALQARAVDDPAWFWGLAVDDLGLSWQRRATRVLDVAGGPEWARWWIGGAFNYAEAATGPRAERDPDGEALAWEGEPGDVRTLTNAELRAAVERAAGSFRTLGVEAGDRVGVFLPMLPETVVTVLGLGLIGAIYTPIFSGYGAPAVAARLADSSARLLVTADGFWRRGRLVAMKAVADEAVAAAPSVERVVVVRRLGEAARDMPWTAGRDLAWDDAMAAGAGADPLPIGPTDPETPYML